MTNDVNTKLDNDNNQVYGLRAGVMLQDDGTPISLVIKDDQLYAEQRLKEENDYLSAVANGEREPTQDRFGTGGMHTARNKENLIGIREGSSPVKGDDPLKVRDFKGDEFDGIIAYGRADEDGKRRPAFWSHFVKEDKTDPNRKMRDEQGNLIPGTPIDNINDLPDQPVFKVCLAETGAFPDHLKNNPSIERTRDAWGSGKPEDKALKLHPRMQKIMEEIAADSENSGIKIELVDDPKEAHCTMMGWSTGARPRLLGFASFPEAMNSWSRLRGLGQERGSAFGFVNNDYANDPAVTDAELRDLLLHEVVRGHVMGGCHPHDLGMLRMSQAEAKESTLMSYSRDHARDFPGTQGGGLGMIDYGIRRWMPNPKKLNTEAGNEYDVADAIKTYLENNPLTSSTREARLLPGMTINNHGEGAVLKGTQGDDLIDTNNGYCSIFDAGTHEGITLKQKVLLGEGKIEVVKGIAGNNKIIPAEQGNQLIEPGTGNSELHFTHQSIGGKKHVHSEGNDTLILSDAVVKRYSGQLKARQDGTNIVIEGGDDAITFSGNALASVRIIGVNGPITELNGEGVTVEALNALFSQVSLPVGLNDNTPVVGSRTAAEAERRAADAGNDRGIA